MRIRYQFFLIVLFMLFLSCMCGCGTTGTPKTGTIDVSSTPRGAEVYLDNQFQGTTPVTITGVSPGTHTVELRLGGYEIWTTSGTMEGGGSATVQATLNPISTPPPVQTQLQAAPSTTPAIVSRVDILSYSSYLAEDGTLHVVGEVKNTGASNLRSIRVIATFYDTSNTVIATDFSYTDITILKPNQKSPFLILEKKYAQNYASFKLDVDYETTKEEPYIGLIIQSPKSDSSTGTYRVMGEVKNTGNRIMKHVKVVGTFYDSSGQVLDAASLEIGEGVPGLIQAFTLISLYPQTSRIKSYELSVQGDF
jgi:hypothetical protein